MPASEGQHHHEGFGQLQPVTTGSYRPEADYGIRPLHLEIVPPANY